jgi:hypothetical protein
VAEWTAQRGAGSEIGTLLGAIWRAGERLAFDAGWSKRWAEGATNNEVRVGLTLGFSLG